MIGLYVRVMKPDGITLTVLDSWTPFGLVTHKLIEILSDSQTDQDLSVVNPLMRIVWSNHE